MSAQDVPVLSEDVAKNHEYVHGAAGTYVETENGPLPSLATQVQKNDAAINETGLLGQVNAGVAAAESAANEAVTAATQSANNLAASQASAVQAAISANAALQSEQNAAASADQAASVVDVFRAALSAAAGSALVGYQHSPAALIETVERSLQKWFSAWEYFTGINPVALSPIVGAIRNNGDQSDPYNFWKLIDYSGHAPVGFRNAAGAGMQIETTDAYIRVHHNIGGNITAGVIAVVDETLAQTGLRIGTSAGENLTDIYMYRDIAGMVSRSAGGDWNVPFSNGIKTITWDDVNKYLVITHADCPNAAINVTQQGGGEPGQWLAQATQVDENTTRVYFVRAQGLVHSARIESNGSDYAVVGNAQNLTIGSYNSGTGDLVLNATGGDVFGYDVCATPYATPYRPAITAAAASSITVNMYNTAGAKVTGAPDVSCKLIVRAQSRRQPTQPSPSTNFAIRWNSRSQINPKSITAADYPAGNLWILGYTARV